MAHLKYKQAIQVAPTSTTTKNAMMTDVEIDGNMKSLNDDIQTRVVRSGDNLTGALNAAAFVTTGSTTNINLAAINSNNVIITGIADIETLGTVSAGATRILMFTDSLRLVHSASLVLTYGVNITTAPGDIAVMVSNGAGVWSMVSYNRNTEVPLGTTSQYYRGDKSWQDLFTSIRAATLTGLSTVASTIITASDTVLSAMGKLQKQIQLKQDTLVSGTHVKTINGSSIVGSGNLQLTNPSVAMPSNGGRCLVNTSYMVNGNSSSGFVFYLPSATAGQFVEFIDMYGNWASGAWYVGYDGTGGKIMGLTENMLVNRSNYNFKLVYTDATGGWRIV